MWFGSAYSALVLLRSISILPGNAYPIRKLLLKAALCALCLVGMDLIYDPLGVSSQLWVWHEPGNYFGTPYQNFVGWFLTGFAIFACYLFLEKPRSKGRLEDVLLLEISFAFVSLLPAVVCFAACWFYLQNCWPIVLTIVIMGPFWIFFVASIRGASGANSLKAKRAHVGFRPSLDSRDVFTGETSLQKPHLHKDTP